MTKNTAESPTFEAALTELEKIVRGLETGGGDLNSSIASYERGMELKKICQDKLKEAQTRIEKITLAADGTPQTEKMDLA